MRPVELVRRADEDVHAERVDVDRAVRRVVDGVRPGQRAHRMRELGDARDVDQRPDRVRRERERDHARPIRELRLEVGEVELAVVVDVYEPDPVPRSRASSSQGAMFASWSRRVTTISSPR